MSTAQTPGRGVPTGDMNPPGRSQPPRPGNITADEEAILRSFVAGNHPINIARSRRTPEATVQRTIRDLCNFNRDHARRVLDSGARLPVPARPPAAPATLAEAEARNRELAGVVDRLHLRVDALQATLDHAQARLDTRRAPHAEYGALWCGQCRQVVAGGHRHPTEPVTVAVMPQAQGVAGRG